MRPTYHIEVSGTPLWVATMPNGTTDRAFAERVAATIPGARLVTVL